MAQYKELVIKDVGGVVHCLNVSTDPRLPPAMDAMPPNMSHRPARDQDLPDQIDAKMALQVMREVCGRLSDPNERKLFAQGMPEVLDSVTPSEHYGNGDRVRGYDKQELLRGMPKPDDRMDDRLAADAAPDDFFAARDDFFRRFPDARRIGTGSFVPPVFRTRR